MGVRITVHADDFERRLRAAALAGVKEQAYAVLAASRERLNSLYPPASDPGESPRRRSGDGYRSTFAHAEPVFGLPTARCGTAGERLTAQGRKDFNYMAHHETHLRPWLLPAFMRSFGEQRAAFERAAREAFYRGGP